MPYTYAFFDLDGTVINSAPGILHSVQYALKKLGIDPPPMDELMGFIGPPLSYSFSRFFGMNAEDASRAVDAYRENYRAGGMLECELYPGIGELIRTLASRGVCVVLATCKPHTFANAILEHFELLPYFTLVSGPELDGTRGEKFEVIEHAIEQLQISDRSRILMIGDRDNDVQGAARCGIDSAGVLWGFGDTEELKDATHLVSNAEALLSLFCDAKKQ